MVPDIYRHIALNLRILRTNLRLPQETVANALSISRTLYTKFENGTRRPDLETLYRLSQFYHVHMDLLFEENPKVFLRQVVAQAACLDKEMELLRAYRRLSLFSKGRLLERANSLLEQENAASPAVTLPSNKLPK